jgi:lactate dehydrogenase-like 2-hydroxyacid dehydrogenase
VSNQAKPDVLSVANLSPFYTDPLKAAYTVHQRLNETDPAAFAQVAPRIAAIAASGESKVGAELIEQLPALKIISVMGVGYDGIDVAAAKARGVVVTHTPGVLNDDVADLALALMLALSRQIARADRFVRAGQWSSGPLALGRKMSGARLGIVGMGRIGQAIAYRAAAFNMAIAYTARSAKPDLPYTYHPTPAALAAESDFLVIITPGGAGTRKLIDAAVLKALGPQGCVVNVARGSVIDESALVEALRSGAIAGAALDVFEDEPNVPQALREMDNVVLTPHIGSATSQTRRAMAELAFANLDAKLTGKPLITPVPECR